MDVLNVIVNNLFKENLYVKKKIIFFISHKNGIKIFLKWVVNYYSKEALTWPIFEWFETAQKSDGWMIGSKL